MHAPLLRLVGKGEVTVVAIGVVRYLDNRDGVLQHHGASHSSRRSGPEVGKVAIGHVTRKAIGDDQVAVAVVVEVGHQGGPTPVSFFDPGQLSNFAESNLVLPLPGNEAVVELHRIAHVLMLESVAGVVDIGSIIVSS